jgi:hypothetical protein
MKHACNFRALNERAVPNGLMGVPQIGHYGNMDVACINFHFSCSIILFLPTFVLIEKKFPDVE